MVKYMDEETKRSYVLFRENNENEGETWFTVFHSTGLERESELFEKLDDIDEEGIYDATVVPNRHPDFVKGVCLASAGGYMSNSYYPYELDLDKFEKALEQFESGEDPFYKGGIENCLNMEAADENNS